MKVMLNMRNVVAGAARLAEREEAVIAMGAETISKNTGELKIHKSRGNNLNFHKMKRNFWTLTIMIVLSAGLMSCETDMDCSYIANINNNTSYDIVVHFPNDSTIICPPSQTTTIIDEYYGTGVTTSGGHPLHSVFRDNIAKIIIDEGNKTLTKDISNVNNWNFKSDKYKNGKFYGKIDATFVINEEDIK